jgi:hypothetical protein
MDSIQKLGWFIMLSGYDPINIYLLTMLTVIVLNTLVWVNIMMYKEMTYGGFWNADDAT